MICLRAIESYSTKRVLPRSGLNSSSSHVLDMPTGKKRPFPEVGVGDMPEGKSAERVLPQSGLNSANNRVGDMPTGKKSLPPK